MGTSYLVEFMSALQDSIRTAAIGGIVVVLLIALFLLYVTRHEV